MKRSEINQALKEMEAMIREYRIALPPFCNLTPQEWQGMNHEYDEIRDNMLGWDITDYGLGRFDEVGFSLITLRNGNPKKKDQYPKPYAEKLLYIKEGQMAPMHFHWYKMEDIINRGGGNVLIRVYNSTPEGEFADTPVTVHCDGRAHTVPAGTQVRLTPGQSITVFQNMYHDFDQELVRCCWEKFPCAMMMSMTTGSMSRSEDSRRSKKTSRLIACSATNIQSGKMIR